MKKVNLLFVATFTLLSSVVFGQVKYQNGFLTTGRGGKGCVVVFSAGNFNNSSLGYPANSNSNIVVVGALSWCGERKSSSSCDGEYWWGSNYGTELDIMAPGVGIPTTTLGSNYDTFNGTSAAVPHVAGLAALVLSINPNLTQKQVADILEQTAQKVGGYSYSTVSGRPNGTWDNEVGYGLLNAFAAVNLAGGCNTVNYINQTVSSNTTVAGCIVTTQNVIVNAGAKLTLAGTQYVILNSNFEVKSGANFEIL